MKTFASNVQTLLEGKQQAAFALVVSFDDLGVKLTNHYRAITYGGASYSAAVFVVKGLSENFVTETPAASIEITSLDDTWQARLKADSLRGTDVTISILIDVSGTWTATGWSQTLTCDSEAGDSKKVTIRLGSSDAVNGTEVPRRTTQEAGCQFDFQRRECPFRWRQGMSEALRTCDKTLDGPLGCTAHFPDVTGADGVVRQVPLPYGGFIGNMARGQIRGA